MIIYTIIKFIFNLNIPNKISKLLLDSKLKNKTIEKTISNKVSNTFNDPVKFLNQELGNYKTTKEKNK